MATFGEVQKNVMPIPWLTTLVLVLSDLLALGFSWTLALVLRPHTGNTIEPGLYLRFFPFLLTFSVLYLGFGLYPALGIPPVLELRKLWTATFLGFLFVGAGAFLFKGDPIYPHFPAAFVLALLLLPISRAALRHWFSQKAWWGGGLFPQGDEEALRPIIDAGKKLGLKPAPYGPWTYAVVTDSVPEEGLPDFPRVLLPVEALCHWKEGILWAEIRDWERVQLLEIKQNLLLPENLFLKRVFDILGGLLLMIPFLALLPLVALLLWLEDRGGPFYLQRRVGKGGKEFYMVKFRTMRKDSERILAEYLKNPQALEEWQRTQKLRDDPRVLRVGRLLRRLSLDELPQAWNILRGEMSLVGPRPALKEQMQLYGSVKPLYFKVRPGLTGLWQVSGRNHLPYERRVELDRYYVQNWSVWLDLYILARTFWAVLRREGAW